MTKYQLTGVIIALALNPSHFMPARSAPGELAMGEVFLEAVQAWRDTTDSSRSTDLAAVSDFIHAMEGKQGLQELVELCKVVQKGGGKFNELWFL